MLYPLSYVGLLVTRSCQVLELFWSSAVAKARLGRAQDLVRNRAPHTITAKVDRSKQATMTEVEPTRRDIDSRPEAAGVDALGVPYLSTGVTTPTVGPGNPLVRFVCPIGRAPGEPGEYSEIVPSPLWSELSKRERS